MYLATIIIACIFVTSADMILKRKHGGNSSKVMKQDRLSIQSVLVNGFCYSYFCY